MAASDSRARPGAGSQAKREILAAAAEVFHEFGYAAATIDEVADRLGATKGRIYHYYRSKADLYFDIQLSAMDRLIAAVEPLARGPGTAVERLRAMAFQHALMLMTDMPSQKVSVQGLERRRLGTNSIRHSKTVHKIIKLRDEYEKIFAGVIDDGIRAGEFVDIPARLATKPFFGSINWLTIWFASRHRQSMEDIHELAEVHADFAVRALRKETSA